MPHALAGGNLTFNPLYKEVKNHITRSLIAIWQWLTWPYGGIRRTTTKS